MNVSIWRQESVLISTGADLILWTIFLATCLGGHPVLSGHLAIPRGCPLNTGSTVKQRKNGKFTSNYNASPIDSPPLPLGKIGGGAPEGRGGLYTGYSWTTGLWQATTQGLPPELEPLHIGVPQRDSARIEEDLCWASDFKGLTRYRRQILHFSSSLKKTKGASACRVGVWEQECLFTMRKGTFYGSVNSKRANSPRAFAWHLSFCFGKAANALWSGRAFIQNSGGSRERVQGVQSPPY